MGPFSFLSNSKTPFCIGLIYLKVPSLLLNSEISFSISGVLFFLLLRKFVFSFFCFRRVLEQNGQVHVTPMWTIQCLEFQTFMFGIPYTSSPNVLISQELPQHEFMVGTNSLFCNIAVTKQEVQQQ